MNKLMAFIFVFVLCFSSAIAVSEWQTSTYASNTGLQIVYPKLDYYKVTDEIVTFNFNVFDENNTHLDNSTTACAILIFNENGSRIVSDYLRNDTLNFYYIWNKTNYTEPNSYYYTVFCNQVVDQIIVAKGFTSNNFFLNYGGKTPLENTNYLPIIFCIVGICFLLIYISNSLGEQHGFLKLILLLFVLLFFIAFGVMMLNMTRGIELSFYSLTLFMLNSWFLRVVFAYILIYLLWMFFDKMGLLLKMKKFMRMK